MKTIYILFLAGYGLLQADNIPVSEIDVQIEKFHHASSQEKPFMFERLKKLIVKMNMDEQSKTIMQYEKNPYTKRKHKNSTGR